MKIRFFSMRKYKISKMPIRFYLPRITKYWGGKIWQFSILRDYIIELDFRNFKITDLLTDKEKKRFNLGMWLRNQKN